MDLLRKLQNFASEVVNPSFPLRLLMGTGMDPCPQKQAGGRPVRAAAQGFSAPRVRMRAPGRILWS